MRPRTQPGQTREGEVVAQAPSEFFLFGAISAALGGFFLIPFFRTKPDAVASAVFGGGFFVLGVFLGLQGLARVTADSHGLRWRNVWSWKKVTWGGVTDFYLEPPIKGQKQFVVIARGQQLRFTSRWPGFEPTAKAIAARAYNAPAREWEVLGTRSVDPYPRNFDYRCLSTQSRQALWISAICAGVLLGVWLFNAIPAIWPGTNELETFRIAYMGCLLFLFMCPILYANTLPVREVLRRRRRGEQITITPDGIEYRDKTQQGYWKWSQVRAISLKSYGQFLQLKGRYVVEADTGETFDFVQPMKGSYELAHQIAAHTEAFKLGEDVWKLAAADTPEPTPRTGHATFYGNRSREARTALLGAAAVVAVVVTGALVELFESYNAQFPIDKSTILLSAIIVMGYAIMVVWYLRAGIKTTEHGIERLGLLRRRSIRWDDITSYYIQQQDDKTRFVLETSDTKLYFAPEITNVAGLLAEVQARAVNSKTKEWTARSSAKPIPE